MEMEMEKNAQKSKKSIYFHFLVCFCSIAFWILLFVLEVNSFNHWRGGRCTLNLLDGDFLPPFTHRIFCYYCYCCCLLLKVNEVPLFNIFQNIFTLKERIHFKGSSA
eukprot:m.132105 g.132105  ORF g.132105 m.132105 type:complete len:107 (-) comp13085_c0_seq6:2065-2385(-)